MNIDMSARLVGAIGEVWAGIRRRNPDVPDVVISVGAGAKKNGLTLGHFAASAWQSGEDQVSELFIGGEGLKSGAEEVLATLLHEAAHGVAHTRGIKDTSRQGRYHNDKYRALAQEVGLTVTKSTQLGWSACQLAEDTTADYAAELDQLAAVLVAHRRTFGRVDDGGRKSNNNGITAECQCPRKIRVSCTSYDAGPIVCGVCHAPFTAPETDNDETGNDEGGNDEAENEGAEQMSEVNYVAGQARRWAQTDPLMRWVAEAPDVGGRLPVDDELIGDYLANNNPFPDGSTVEVLRRDDEGGGWETAVIQERIGPDEWLIEYTEDGAEAYRDHHELRPAP